MCNVAQPRQHGWGRRPNTWDKLTARHVFPPDEPTFLEAISCFWAHSDDDCVVSDRVRWGLTFTPMQLIHYLSGLCTHTSGPQQHAASSCFKGMEPSPWQSSSSSKSGGRSLSFKVVPMESETMHCTVLFCYAGTHGVQKHVYFILSHRWIGTRVSAQRKRKENVWVSFSSSFQLCCNAFGKWLLLFNGTSHQNVPSWAILSSGRVVVSCL